MEPRKPNSTITSGRTSTPVRGQPQSDSSAIAGETRDGRTVHEQGVDNQLPQAQSDVHSEAGSLFSRTVESLKDGVTGLLGRLWAEPEPESEPKDPLPLEKSKSAKDVLPEYRGALKQGKVWDYDKGESIGKGAFGEVKKVVPKQPWFGLSDRPQTLYPQQVLKEVDLTNGNNYERNLDKAKAEVANQNLNSQGLKVGSHQLSSDMTKYQILMEYGGVELPVLMKAGGDTPAQRALPEGLGRDMAYQLMTQLEEIHAKHAVHGDIKPKNLMVNNQGKLSVIDFGLSRKDVSGRKGDWFSGVRGAPGYMAPEIQPGQRYTAKVDVWAAGLVLAYILTGEIRHEIFSDKAYDEFRQFIQSHPTLDANAKELVLNMVEKDPEKRFDVEQVLNSPFFNEGGDIDEVSFPELQTAHARLFRMIAQSEHQFETQLMKAKQNYRVTAAQKRQLEGLQKRIKEFRAHILVIQEKMQAYDRAAEARTEDRIKEAGASPNISQKCNKLRSNRSILTFP